MIPPLPAGRCIPPDGDSSGEKPYPVLSRIDSESGTRYHEPMTVPDPSNVASTLDQAISGCLPRGFVTAWSAVVEYIDPETGDRNLYTLHSNELTQWGALGLLDYGASKIRSEI